MSEFIAFPRTLHEMRANVSAYSLDTTKPPYYRSRYASKDDAVRASKEAGVALFLDSFGKDEQ